MNTELNTTEVLSDSIDVESCKSTIKVYRLNPFYVYENPRKGRPEHSPVGIDSSVTVFLVTSIPTIIGEITHMHFWYARMRDSAQEVPPNTRWCRIGQGTVFKLDIVNRNIAIR